MTTETLPTIVRALHDDVVRIACLEIERLHCVGQTDDILAILDALVRIIGGAGGGGGATA